MGGAVVSEGDSDVSGRVAVICMGRRRSTHSTVPVGAITQAIFVPG